MNKKEFMQKLKDGLIGLNQNDKREVLLDYEEHFMDGKNQGRTEEEICAALGNPAEIAKEIKMQSQQGAPNNDGVNMAGYIIGIIVLSAACLALASILFSVVSAAVSGIFGAVAVAAIVTEPMLKLAAVSAVIFTVTICTLIALGIVKLIPLVVKWYKQLVYSLDGKEEKAKNLEHKKIKIHPIVWILVSLLCLASLGGIIGGGVGFAKEVVRDMDVEDVHSLREFVEDVSHNHRGWVYYGGYDADEFEAAMEDFADDMEDFADEMEETFDEDDGWFFIWKYIFGDN